MAYLLRECRFNDGDYDINFSVWTDLADANDLRRVRLNRAIAEFSDGAFRNFAIICKNHIGQNMAYVPVTNPEGGDIGAMVFADRGYFSVTRNLSNALEYEIFLHITYSLD